MSHQLLSEKTEKFLDVATYQSNPHAPVDLAESDEVVTARINEAHAHLSRMFGSHISKVVNGQINEAVNAQLSKVKQGSSAAQRNIAVGDKVQTIMQGQQQGTVEKIEKQNGIIKVYHRHANGNLYASSPSNLRIVNESAPVVYVEKTIDQHYQSLVEYVDHANSINEGSTYGNAKYPLANPTTSDRELKKKIVAEHLAVISQLKEKIAAAATPEEADVHQAAHDLEVAKLANTQTYTPGGIVESASPIVGYILEQINATSFDALDESTQTEIINIASDLAPHL